MNIKMVLTALCIVLAGCVTPQVPTSHSEILDEYRAMSQRLDRLAAPLLEGSLGLCSNKSPDVGIGYHSLDTYPDDLQPVAKTYWGLGTDKTVLYVRAGGAAEKVGLGFGDIPSVEALKALAKNESICGFGTQVRIQPNKNAFANGRDIIVTNSLMRSVDDLALSLIIGHELAHNILGEKPGISIAEREAEADRWAIFLMARAGLDYNKAVRKFAAVTPPHGSRVLLHDVQKARFRAFRKVASEVKALQRSGEPLEP